MRQLVAPIVALQVVFWQMPKFSWGRLIVIFHSSNLGGPYSDEQCCNMSNYSTVTFETWQGVHNYFVPGYNGETCQNMSGVSKCGCCFKGEMVGMGQRLKTMNPTTMVCGYLNSQQVYPLHRLAHQVATRPDLWIRDLDGEVVLAGDGPWLLPDLEQQEARHLA